MGLSLAGLEKLVAEVNRQIGDPIKELLIQRISGSDAIMRIDPDQRLLILNPGCPRGLTQKGIDEQQDNILEALRKKPPKPAIRKRLWAIRPARGAGSTAASGQPVAGTGG